MTDTTTRIECACGHIEIQHASWCEGLPCLVKTCDCAEWRPDVPAWACVACRDCEVKADADWLTAPCERHAGGSREPIEGTPEHAAAYGEDFAKEGGE